MRLPNGSSAFPIYADLGVEIVQVQLKFSFYVGRGTQARWVSAAYRIANTNPWIAGLGWVTLLDEPRRSLRESPPAS